MRNLLFVFVLISPATLRGGERRCFVPDEAMQHLNKVVCISAHVYKVVELADGTRFLDVCSSEARDEDCRFSIVSRAEDRADVGDLSALRDKDIDIRGTVRPFGGRSEIELTHVRQLHGGPEKFRPSPALLAGFSAEHEKPGFNDKAASGVQHKGSFSTKKRR
ncbi:MAG TPA: hypothetical protein VGD64_05235 [Acidisarcina sp.]